MPKSKRRMESGVFYAAQKGDVDAIAGLYKADPQLLSTLTLENNNVLHIAAREGHSGFVEWILDHVRGSDRMFLARNSDFNTPLHEAAKGGDADVVSILITFAKRPSVVVARYLKDPFQILNEAMGFSGDFNVLRETPLLIACKCGHEGVAKHLLEAKPVNQKSRIYQPYLYVAASKGHQGIVDLLLKETYCTDKWQAELSRSDAQAANPLHASVYGEHIHIVQQILRSKLSIHSKKTLMTTKDRHGWCAIHVAVVIGNSEIFDEFMSSMPDSIELRSSDYKTVVHLAVAYDRFQIVHKLLSDERQDRIANRVINEYDKFGNTALHLAAQNAVDPKLVEYLLSFPGVKVNAVNNEGLTPMGVAVANASTSPNSTKIRELLNEAGGSATYTPQSNPNEVTRSVSEKREERDNKLTEAIDDEFFDVATLVAKDNKLVDVDTLVASLIATVTFAAIFQVPGGIEDDKSSLHYGVARLGFQSTFKLFIFSDTVALFTSLVVVFGWILGKRLKSTDRDKVMYTLLSAACLAISMVFTAIAFLSAANLMLIPPNIRALKTTHPNDFNQYRQLFSCVFIGGILPITLAFAAWCSYMVLIRAQIPNYRYSRTERAVFGISVLVVLFFLGL